MLSRVRYQGGRAWEEISRAASDSPHRRYVDGLQKFDALGFVLRPSLRSTDRGEIGVALDACRLIKQDGIWILI